MTTTNADLIAAEWQTEIERPYVEMLDALTAKLAESELEFNQCSSMLNNAERRIEELEQQLAAKPADMSAQEPVAAPEGWQPIETAPKDGTAFRAYADNLIDLDFNPWGSVEAVFDGEQIIGCIWNGQQDCWYGKPISPTHWMPLPAAPSAP
mgnify:CR=1 FL=1